MQQVNRNPFTVKEFPSPTEDIKQSSGSWRLWLIALLPLGLLITFLGPCVQKDFCPTSGMMKCPEARSRGKRPSHDLQWFWQVNWIWQRCSFEICPFIYTLSKFKMQKRDGKIVNGYIRKNIFYPNLHSFVVICIKHTVWVIFHTGLIILFDYWTCYLVKSYSRWIKLYYCYYFIFYFYIVLYCYFSVGIFVVHKFKTSKLITTNSQQQFYFHSV